MSFLKRLLRPLGALALSVTFLAVALLAWALDDLRGLRYRLLEDIRALTERTDARPVQAQPILSGDFGQLATQPWAALAALQTYSSDLEDCRGVQEGERPFAQVPPGCLRQLSQSDEPLRALLRATHAENARPPADLAVLEALGSKEQANTLATAAYVGRMAALRMRAQLASGQPVAAVITCVDVLALARDLTWGTGLVGRLAALSVSETALAPCAAALSSAPSAAKRRAALGLALVANGTPPLAVTFADTSVALRMQLFGPYLAEALPGVPTRTAARPHPSLIETVVLVWKWDRLQSLLLAAVEAARLPPPEDQRRLLVLGARAAPFSQTLGGLFPDLRSVAIRDQRARARLLALGQSARVKLPRPTPADVTWAKANGTDVTLATLTLARDAYARTCSPCHALPLPTEFPAKLWPKLVDEMVDEQNVKLSPEQRQQIEEFLTVMSRTR
ncbi:MAG: hypothetical protein ACLQDQ_05055 [Myxococcaceae bacterium]